MLALNTSQSINRTRKHEVDSPFDRREPTTHRAPILSTHQSCVNSYENSRFEFVPKKLSVFISFHNNIILLKFHIRWIEQITNILGVVVVEIVW